MTPCCDTSEVSCTQILKVCGWSQWQKIRACWRRSNARRVPRRSEVSQWGCLQNIPQSVGPFLKDTDLFPRFEILDHLCGFKLLVFETLIKSHLTGKRNGNKYLGNDKGLIIMKCAAFARGGSGMVSCSVPFLSVKNSFLCSLNHNKICSLCWICSFPVTHYFSLTYLIGIISLNSDL